jgi:hypothetical protein
MAQSWKFNATGICESSSSEDLLFSGSLLFPGDRKDHDWADNVYPTTIAGEFDDQTASIYIDGLFEALGVNTELAGKLAIRFAGQIDKDRSDILELGDSNPAWEPVLGFREEDGDSSAVSIFGVSIAIWVSILALAIAWT